MSERKDIHNSEIPEVCVSCEARHRGICGALKPNQLLALSKHTTRRSYEAGTELVRDAEPVSAYSNVISGVVKLSKLLADGRQQIVGLQFAPDFLGRPLKSESQLSAEAATTVSLCSFPKASLERLMAEAPELEHKLLEQSLKELDEAREWMVALGRKTAAERVAHFLYLIAMHVDPEAELDEDSSIAFDLPLTRADIADFLGLTIETVSRQITKLRKAEIIKVENNRHVTIPNLGYLRDVSGS
ncbi:MAG: Crp/Fnr family transcriptional regulator [Pseudomonadota bacterium]